MGLPLHFAPRRLILAAPALLVRPAAAQVPLTPAQMEGPYFPRAIPADADADLMRVAGQPRMARGQPLRFEGVVRGPQARVPHFARGEPRLGGGAHAAL